MSKLIILRGNSASGKTTTTTAIQNHFPRGMVMKISQDDIRLGILNVKDRAGNPTPELIRQIAEFGKGKFDIIMIEGILGAHIYKEMFTSLYESFQSNVYAYYYDISFEETLARHSQRDLSKVFGAERMKKWWLEKDVLGFPNETLLPSKLSQEEVINIILKDIQLE